MKNLLLIISLFYLGCSENQEQPRLHITKISNSAIRITGLDYTVMQELRADSAAAWQSLVPIYKMPADTDMKDYQKAQPGKYRVIGQSLVFNPDTPFMYHQTYFIRYLNHDTNKSAFSFLKSKRKPGAINYTDLIFNY